MKTKSEASIMAILLTTIMILGGIMITASILSLIYDNNVQTVETKQVTFYTWENRCEVVPQVLVTEERRTVILS